MKFTDLPTRHDQLTEAVVRLPGVLPSHCHGMLARVDAEGAMIPEDSPPILDHSSPMEGDPLRAAPVYLERCLTCHYTPVLEECLDANGETFFRLRNDAIAKPETSGRSLVATT